jgi:hypothetical protein
MRLILSFILLSSFSTFAQKEYAKRIMDTLCSPHFDGRGYVNQGDVRAADFIVNEITEIGLQSFKGSTFTQDYSFGVNTFPHPIEVILGEDTLVPGVDYLVNPISGSAQGTFNLVELNRENYFTTYGGKINFKEMDPSQTVFVFNFLNLRDKELEKKLNALSYEATKYFPIISITNQKQMYSVARNYSNYPLITVDSVAYHQSSTASIKIDNTFIPQYQTKNIIGYIPGKKKKKYIVLSAHYDHLGRMGADTYFPGANDNASGVAMLLSMAKYYKVNKPKYSIVFCFFSGEEAGLIGSDYFVSHPYFPLNKVKFVLNVDIMGGAEEGVTVVNATKHEKEYQQLVGLNESNQLIAQVKKRGPSANSDHYFFSEKGVPAFFIYSMGSVKNYHDIYDTAENTPLNKFDEVQQLLQLFVAQLK